MIERKRSPQVEREVHAHSLKRHYIAGQRSIWKDITSSVSLVPWLGLWQLRQIVGRDITVLICIFPLPSRFFSIFGHVQARLEEAQRPTVDALLLFQT